MLPKTHTLVVPPDKLFTHQYMLSNCPSWPFIYPRDHLQHEVVALGPQLSFGKPTMDLHMSTNLKVLIMKYLTPSCVRPLYVQPFLIIV